MEDPRLLEAQILYSVINNPAWMDEITDMDEIDFRNFPTLFSVLKRLHQEQKTIDYVIALTYTQEAREVADIVLSSDNLGLTIIPKRNIFEERVNELKNISYKNIIKQELESEVDIATLKEKLERIYKKGASRWLTPDEIRKLANELLQNKIQNEVLYHLHLLDYYTSGISKGQYIIVAGRPSVGKSAFLQYVGLANAKKGKKVLFVSAEMGEEMITSRILKTHQPEEIPNTFHILIAGSTQTIEAEINKKARDFDLILVDYIQLLKPKIKTKDMYERVTYTSAELKEIATRFNLPLVCASQFSRRAEKGQPSLADLKESGALEQDADVVISLWKKPGDDDLITQPNLTKVRVDLLKNRNGGTFINTDEKDYLIMFKKDEFRYFDIENYS
jgi:replicative DNA helicase